MAASITILPCVLVSLFCLTSGTVDVYFLRHIPRLSNTSYWDNYYRCSAVGETLQWIVSNNSLNRYQRQNVALVLAGSTSNFSYFATLLSAETVSVNEFNFKSVLFVTSSSNFSVDVTCSNGSISAAAVNDANGPGIEEAANTVSIYLEYILTDDKDDSNPTSIFVCGVENNFMKLQVNEDDDTDFLFSHFDRVGVERRLPQDIDTNVEQQAILIGKNEPYQLVIVIFVIDDSPVTLTCGYEQRNVSLTSRQLAARTENTQHSTASETNESLTTSTNTRESQRSTTGITGTAITESTDDINIVAILTSIIIVLVILGGFLILGCGIFISQKVQKKTRASSSINEEEMTEFILNTPDEKPLKENNCGDIKPPKPIIEGTDYDIFCKKVQFMILTMNDNELNAATTFITAPDVEDSGNVMTTLGDNIYIGMFENHPVGVVQDKTGEKCEEMLTNAIKNYFVNVKYILNVGVCYSFDPTKNDFGDVLVSRKIYGAIPSQETHILPLEISSELQALLCENPDDVVGLKVSKNFRRANHFVVAFASCVNIIEDEFITNILGNYEETYGIDKVGQQLLSMQEKGLKMADNIIKPVQVAIINGVTGFIGYNMDRIWDFIAAQAAFHYVTSKLGALSTF